MCVCVCVCVCVCGYAGGRDFACVCVCEMWRGVRVLGCVCVCVCDVEVIRVGDRRGGGGSYVCLCWGGG
jgi:hypothetical protein